MRSALYYVIDAYDEYLGSVEQSHYDDLGYYEVANFNLPDTVDTLDLIWMKKDDIFSLEANDQFQSIREIQVNIDNLGYSHLPVKSISKNGALLTINGSESKSSIIQQIKGFKSFLTDHFAYINSLKLVGFTPIVETLLALYAKKRCCCY